MKTTEISLALNHVYGAVVTVTEGYWNYVIETTPSREVVFYENFLKKYIDADTLTIKDFEAALSKIPENRWMMSDGSLLITSYDIEQYL